MNWLSRQRPAHLYAAVIVIFLVSRVFFFAVTTAGEYRLYKDYGDAARQTSLDELYRTRNIEYPHLGVAFGAAVGLIADQLPGEIRHLVRLRPNKYEIYYQDESEDQHGVDDRYEAALGLVLFVLDVWCLWLVHAIVRRVYPGDGAVVRAARLLGYAVFTGLTGLILYDRQDLVVAWFALLAIRFLCVGRPRAGYVILMIGAAYKLVPMLLLPVWVLAATRIKAGLDSSKRRFVRTLVVEATIAGAIFAIWPACTYAFGGGEKGFRFLFFHAERGLQMEAPAAWPVFMLHPDAEIGHSYGGYNLRDPLADRVAKALGIIAPLVLLGCLGIVMRNASRKRKRRENPSVAYASDSLPDLERKPVALVPFVVQSSLLMWLAFIAFNKVGSPQYLIWIAPLIPLLPLRSPCERGWAALVLVVLLATMLIYPCRYKPDLLGDIVKTDPSTWRGPNALGVFLLGAKSITLMISTLWLAALAGRQPHLSSESHR